MLALILSATVAALCASAYLWARRRNRYWYRTRVPHLPGRPLVGNFGPILRWQTGIVQLFRAMYDDPRVRSAPAFGMHIFHNPTLVVRAPELVRQVMVRDFASFTDRYSHSDTHDPIGNLNILFARGSLWRRLRQRLTPFFSSGKLRQMFGLIAEVGAEMNARLLAMSVAAAAGQTGAVELEVKDYAARYTTDVIASCAYGVRANALADPESAFRRNGRKVFTFNLWRMLEVTAVHFLPEVSKWFRFRLFGAESTRFFKRMIEHVMGERERTQESRKDLIDMLIQLKNEDAGRTIASDDFRFAGDMLVAQASIFFTAGFETSSSTISFGLYELSKQPLVQQRLRDEICTTLLKNDDKQLTYEAVMQMEYLDQVVSEILRMHPIMPFLDRRATLPPGQRTYSLRPFVDYELEAGMGVIVPIAAIQRDPLYWPEPDRFDPERFAPANRANIVPYTFLPFGVGPRSCIGERFGLLQSKVGLVSLLRNHRVEPSERMGGGALEYSKKSMFLQTERGIFVNVVRDPLLPDATENRNTD